MMGVELGKTVMSLDMGPLGVLQLYSYTGNQRPSWGMLRMHFFLQPTCCCGLYTAYWDLAWRGDVMLVLLNSRN